MDKGQTHILKGILYEYGNAINTEDWQKCAFPMNEIMEDLGNHRYLED